MTFIACCQKANQEGLQIIRSIGENDGDYEAKNFTDPPPGGQGWVYLDAWTASAVCAVYDALNETNKEKLEKLPFMAAINVCWKLVK